MGRFWLILLLVLAPWQGQGQERLRLGILAYRPLPQEVARWAPLEQYLEEALPGMDVAIYVLDLPELDAAVRQHQLDAVLTNPGHYLLLQRQHGLGRALATLVRWEQGMALREFGGVAFARAERQDLNSWSDLQGKTIAYASRESLGSYQLQAYELVRRGINQEAIRGIAVGRPYDRVVEAVLSGRAEVGFVRSGVLEAMAREGRIDLSQVRVIAKQNLGAYPLAVSTALYPEWPLAAMAGLDAKFALRLALALYAMEERAPAVAKAMGIAGFTLPADYTPVEEMLKALDLPPFVPEPISWEAVIQQYRWQLLAAGLAFLFLAMLLFRTRWLQSRLEKALARERAHLREIAVLARTFDTHQGVIITDPQRRIQRVNAAFTQITGYTEEEAIGKTPAELLHSGLHDLAFYREMWRALKESGSWAGEIWNRRKDGSIYPEYLTVSAVRDENGELCHYVGVFSDLSEIKAAEARIRELAFYDPLTELANRRLAFDHLQQALAESARTQELGALCFIDLDNFKEINDTKGHSAGDACLKVIANRMRGVLRRTDTLARLGGDEFLVILERLGLHSKQAARQAEQVVRKLLVVIGAPLNLEGETYHLTASMGVVLFDGRTGQAEALLKQADIAMYAAKTSGRANVRFFDAGMEEALKERAEIERALKQAIAREELCLFCQPQVNDQGGIVGAELLLRWQHPTRGLLNPGAFLPIAEETSLILDLGVWVSAQAQQLLIAWAEDERLKTITLSFNVSAKQLRHTAFLETMRSFLSQHSRLAARLEVEITESLVLDDIELAETVLGEWAKLGSMLALDDFGTGYSSLSYLSRLPFHTLKIDKSFTQRLHEDTKIADIVRAIVGLGKALRLRVVAEGVESEEQCQALRALGCNCFQGYFFARPMPVSEFVARVRAGAWLSA